MLRMMVRPRWVLALLFALALAAAFAFLGQWQLERAIESNTATQANTETPVPLESIVQPGALTQQQTTGHMVTVTGAWAPADYQIVSGRRNGDQIGYWVVGHLATSQPDTPGLAVALGWSATEAQARNVAQRLSSTTDPGERQALLGRFLPSEAPTVPENAPATTMTTVAVAQLVNLWHDFDNHAAYFGYVIASAAPDGLVPIAAPPPEAEVQFNWLNIFYAVEWVVFAGFALFLWYRLVRDAYEREQDAQQKN